MIPGNILSPEPVIAAYLYPDNLDVTKTVDYELAGLAVDDPSEGLEYQGWKLTYADPDIIVTPLTVGNPVVLFSMAGIEEVSLAFDQNMHPFIAYVIDSQAWYWWYDPIAQAQVHVEMDANVTTPKCCMDDKRDTQTSVSDIILAYIKDNSDLYFKHQSDRFVGEFELATDLSTPFLNRVGMNEKTRLQFLFRVSL